MRKGRQVTKQQQRDYHSPERRSAADRDMWLWGYVLGTAGIGILILLIWLLVKS